MSEGSSSPESEPDVVMQEPVPRGTSLDAIIQMNKTGKVDVVLDGDERKKENGSGAFYNLRRTLGHLFSRNKSGL